MIEKYFIKRFCYGCGKEFITKITPQRHDHNCFCSRNCYYDHKNELCRIRRKIKVDEKWSALHEIK